MTPMAFWSLKAGYMHFGSHLVALESVNPQHYSQLKDLAMWSIASIQTKTVDPCCNNCNHRAHGHTNLCKQMDEPMNLQHDYAVAACINHSVAAWSWRTNEMGNNSGGHAAAAWVFNVVHNQVLLIYSRITPHLAMAYVRHFSASNNAIAAMMRNTGNCKFGLFNFIY